MPSVPLSNDNENQNEKLRTKTKNLLYTHLNSREEQENYERKGMNAEGTEEHGIDSEKRKPKRKTLASAIAPEFSNSYPFTLWSKNSLIL